MGGEYGVRTKVSYWPVKFCGKHSVFKIIFAATSMNASFPNITLEQLPQVAQLLAALLREETFVAFYGPMGAGKTTLIKEVLRAAGSTDHVSSPTFSLVNEYALPDGGVIYHFDFYRIKDLEEVYDMGYEEYFYSGHPCLVEWPELIEPLLPLPRLEVHLSLNADGTRHLEWKKCL